VASEISLATATRSFVLNCSILGFFDIGFFFKLYNRFIGFEK